MSADADERDINTLLEPPQSIDPAIALNTLKSGQIELYGLMPWSSNYTFLGLVHTPELKFNIIYKPCRGERPLWDFESNSLCKREVAAYKVSQALGGWPAIPPTVLRDGPHGFGSVQQFIHANYEVHYFSIKDDPQHGDALQRLAIFDYLVNNADRKGGHCLLDSEGRIWAIDHGLTFHTDHKLRTVIWDYANQPIPAHIYAELEKFKQSFNPQSDIYQTLTQLISLREIEQFYQRLDTLLTSGKFPRPLGYRDYPYPPV